MVGSSRTRKFAPDATTSASAEPAALAARELVDPLLVVVPAGEEEAAEERLRLRPLQARRAHRALEHAAALVELDLVLGEVGELDAVADPADLAGDDPLEQRRLAGAVRSDQGDVLAALQHELRVLQEGLRACGKVEALGLDHHPPASCRLQELEAERAPADTRRLDALRLDPRDLLQLRLRLPRLRPVAEAGDKPFEPGDVLGLPLRPRRLVGEPRGLLLAPHVPLAREEDGAAALELEHGRRDRLEEPAIVRDEDDGGVDRRELLLEPFHRGHVEVVGRLVEEEQIRPAGERSRERGARQLAAGEGLERAVEVGVREAEAAQDCGGVVAPAVAARVLEPRLRLAVAPERLGTVIAGRHRLLEPAQLALGLDEVGGPRKNVLAQREAAEPRRALIVERDAGALLPGELAARELGLAHERPQQRRLAGAVRAGERQPVAALELERDAVEERVAGELLAQARCDQDRHAPRVVPVDAALGAGRRISLRL